MAIENITLNIIPTGDTPSIHVAQFDVDRPFNVTLKEGEDDFTPTGYDIELQVRKVDSTIVTVVPLLTTGNVVTFNTTEQMTACSGTNIAELQLTKDSQTFATLHFYLVVQRDVLAGGVTSESDIYNLTEQIAAIVPEVIGDDYYNKEEVDEKIAEIPTFDPTNYYNKSQTDALLNDKADVSDLPDMTDYYTKSEVDSKISDLYQVKTASGDIAHFLDGGNDIPVNSFECDIGSSGFSQADITVCGKNLTGFSNIDFTVSGMRFYSDGTTIKMNGTSTAEISSINTNFKDKLSFTLPAGDYYVSANTPNGVGIYLRRYSDNTTIVNIIPSTFTLTEPTKIFWGIYVPNNKTLSDHNTQFNITKGNIATTYEAYKGTTYTVEFGSTFNDGTLIYENGEWYIDVSGVITPIMSTTKVKTISGENNIFSNTGDVEVEYFTEKSDGIAELIKAFM